MTKRELSRRPKRYYSSGRTLPDPQPSLGHPSVSTYYCLQWDDFDKTIHRTVSVVSSVLLDTNYMIKWFPSRCTELKTWSRLPGDLAFTKAISFVWLLAVIVAACDMVVSPLVARTRQRPCLRPRWTILPTRMNYYSNTK